MSATDTYYTHLAIYLCYVFSALQLASSGLENLHDNLIDYNELKDSLTQQGLYGACEVLEQILPEVTNEQGQVDLPKFMGVLSKVMQIPEAAGVKESLSQINIPKSDENIIPELQEKLNVMGIHLSDEKIQEALDATNVSEDGTIDLKDFVNNLATVKKFREYQKIEDAWDLVNKMSDGKVKVDDVSGTLESLGMKLPDEDLLDVLKLIQPDDDGLVKIKDVVETLAKTPQVTRPHGLKNAWTVVNSVTDGKIKMSDLSPALESWGFELTDEKLKETVKSMESVEPESVNLQDLIKKYTKAKKLSKNQKLQDAWTVVNAVSDGKVKPSDLRSILESIGLDLNPEEIKEILKYVHIDENGTINLNDVINKLTYLQKWNDSQRIRHAYIIVTNVKDGKVKMMICHLPWRTWDSI
uniref:Uncharacterized protein LOC110215832 n=1 Tax=Phascolarctos cinereus TaxID=38626 RepID=A0A6P5L4M6_PHACI|nr:uncharacterized protein LOC110215832 [Phascolarctos cinereus]